IRLFLAYASFKDFAVYQMDVKSAFLYGKIKEEVYVFHPPGFEDPDFPDRVYKVEKALCGVPKKKLCTEFEKIMHKKFQMSSMGELTFFLGLFQVNPKVSHLYVVKRIFRYLKGQPKLGLWYPKDSPFDLVAYTDSDYAGASLDRKSIRGGCQFLGCRLISWQCKKQTVVANYTTEAEYIYIDNESTICIVKNPVFHSKTKHIEIRHHFIRDSNEKKLIQMIKIHTDKNVADLLTKAFDKEIGVNAGDSKLMLLEKVNAARHNLLLLVVKTVNGEVQLQALVDGKKVTIIETSQLALMGYEKPSQKLTFYKALFSPQWKFLIHTSPAMLRLNMVKNVDCSVKFLMYPRFVQVFLDKQIGDMSTHDEIFVTPSHTKKVFGNMQALVDGKKVIITETSVRRDLQLEDAEGIECLPNADIFEQLALMGISLKVWPLQQRVLDLENTKTAQAQEISSLKLRVKRLEKKGGSRTHKLKRLFKVSRSAKVVSSKDEGLGDQEDAFKQGRKIDDIEQDADVTLVDVTQGRYDDAQMFDTYVFNSEEVFVAEKSEKVVEEVVSTAEVSAAATITTEEITLAQALAEFRSAKPKVVVQEPVQSTTTTSPSTIPKAKSITFRDPGESTTRTTLTPIPSNIKDKGKAKMIKPEKPLKKKEKIRLNEELAFKLQAEEEEQARLAREKVEKVEEANISWDNVQAMIKANRLLAERFQAREQEEFTDKEKARLFVELLEKRKKHFAALRAQEKRNKPPTKAQNKKIQKLFDKAMTRVNMFVDMDTELVKEISKKAEAEMSQESSSKRAGEELEQEIAKKQKMEDYKEKENLKQCFEIVQDNEVAINAIPLATKPAIIVDYKIHRKGKQGYYEIMRADGSSKIYYYLVSWSKALTKKIWKLYGKDLIWRNLQGKKVLLLRLYDSCGIHFVRFEDMHVYMLVDKRYPLTPVTITDMLNKKLKSDYWNEMCYQLLKLMTKQLKKQ
ncbi:ribonuclease H-like domain-containing protein, partial [Tanacetum coccineum]